MRAPPYRPPSRRRLSHRAVPFALAAMAATALGDADDPRPVTEASADDAAQPADHVEFVRDAPSPAERADAERAARRERIIRTAATRQAFQRSHPQGGIDVHGRFAGIVDVDTFISAYGGPESLVSHIAASARPHSNQDGYQLEPISEPGPQITGRSATGDCFVRAYTAHSALLEAAANGVESARSPDELKREALVPCLTATGETDIESAFQVREALIQRWPSVNAADYENEHDLKEARYVEYCKSAMRELRDDGVSYSEQAVPAVTLEREIDRSLMTPAKCGGGTAGAPVVRWLASIGPAYFGAYDGRADGTPPARPQDWEQVLTSLRSLLARDDVGGIEIAGPERWRFDGDGKERFKAAYNAIAEAAMVKGKRLVLRADVGLGAVAPEPGRPYHRDVEIELTADGVPLHHDRARHNLEAVISALEELRADGRIRKGHVVVRFGNATHATPDHVRRMRELGVIAEAALGAELSSGSVERHGDPFAHHSFLTFIFYQSPILVVSGGDAAVGTSVRAEYRRTFDMVEQFLSGLRKVRVAYDASTMAGRVAPPGKDGMVWLAADQLSADELERFVNAYACLVDGADQYRSLMAAATGPAGAPTPINRIRAECPRLRL
jgi:hypothetical protein